MECVERVAFDTERWVNGAEEKGKCMSKVRRNCER
jgi:hypothetical protein